MTIRHDEKQQRFSVATEHGEAVVDYRREASKVDFTHTFVPPEGRGKGIAEALVKHALDWAEKNQLSVQASCWYVARYIAARRPHLNPS